jgi:hypothetical protein
MSVRPVIPGLGEGMHREVMLLFRLRRSGCYPLKYTPFTHRRWIHNGPRTRRPRLRFKQLSSQLASRFYHREEVTIYRRRLWATRFAWRRGYFMARWDVTMRRNAQLRWR